MTFLYEAASVLKDVRKQANLSQAELAKRAGVARTTVTRIETLAKGDINLSIFLRLLEAAGYDLKLVKKGFSRTLEDILNEQRSDQSS